MSEVSSGEDSVYLAYFEELHYMSGHYQSIKPAQSLVVEEEVASVPGSLISTLASQAVEVAESPTIRKRPRSDDETPIPIIKLRKTRDGWSKVSF